MLQREPFFGRRNEKPIEKHPPANGIDSPATQLRSTLATATTPPNDDAHRAAKDAAAPPAPKGGEPQGSQLIVGPNIKLKGVEITDCDTLIVEGHVEATMDSRLIQIAPNGTFSGIAGIDIADINGGFSGELTVRRCLTIHATGKVSGKIRYGKLVIEEGGEISGDVSKLSDDDKSLRVQQAPVSNRPGVVPVPAARS